jgi:hypothetical protein
VEVALGMSVTRRFMPIAGAVVPATAARRILNRILILKWIAGRAPKMLASKDDGRNAIYTRSSFEACCIARAVPRPLTANHL